MKLGGPGRCGCDGTHIQAPARQPRRAFDGILTSTARLVLLGEMTIGITLEPVPGGTAVTFACATLRPGLWPEDNEAGACLSLAQPPAASHEAANLGDHSLVFAVTAPQR
jgi:hypothetical protein